jgi:hypothetical protein
MNRQAVLLAVLLGTLVVGLFFLGVVASPRNGEADPERAGGLELLDDVLGAIPGLSNKLSADHVDADCFSRDTFVVEAARFPCAVSVPADVNRVELRVESGTCPVSVRQEGVPRRRVDVDDGRIRISLAETEAVLLLGPGPCRLRLE